MTGATASVTIPASPAASTKAEVPGPSAAVAVRLVEEADRAGSQRYMPASTSQRPLPLRGATVRVAGPKGKDVGPVGMPRPALRGLLRLRARLPGR